MKEYHLEVRVTPRPGLLDPEGNAIQHALESLGFAETQEVRVGKAIFLTLHADSEADAIASAEAMGRKLLANPVTEDFSVSLAADVGVS